MSDHRTGPVRGQGSRRDQFMSGEPYGFDCFIHPDPDFDDDEPAAPRATAGSAWAAQADALAAWTLQWLVNRDDAFVRYWPLELREQKKSNARTIKDQLTAKVLARHYRGADVADLIALHTTSPDNHSCSLGFDIDHHGKPDAQKKRQNRKAAKKLYRRAKALGFTPLLFDSNGRGGYHLVLPFDRPVPTPRVYAFGQWLLKDWQQLGLAEKPEQFPKQPRLTDQKVYGNALRLPGRHHRLDWYTRVWTGKKWAEGSEAIDIILGTKVASPDLIPADVQELETPTPATGPVAEIPLEKLPQVQKRALALLSKKLKAVESHGGDKATWTAALYLVKDFALSVDQALPILKQWNKTHCKPEWTEEKLLYKLRLAEQEPGKRGRLLDDCAKAKLALSPEVAGTPFCLVVPDFILADWDKVQPCLNKRRGRPSPVEDITRALILDAVIHQRCSQVVIPDVAFAQLLWGGDTNQWPTRWRREHKRSLHRAELKFDIRRKCLPSCPLHDRLDFSHRHQRILATPQGLLGNLQNFHVAKGKKEGVYSYNFDDWKSHHPDQDRATECQEHIDKARENGRLFSIYLPAWIFGPAVLPPGPCRILKALTRELTRERGNRSTRPDKAKVIAGTAYVGLDQSKSYVLFGGNGRGKKARLHGKGYYLPTWMERAGYAVEKDSPSYWKEVRRFLTDLRSLCEPFGLVAAGYRSDERHGRPLVQLIAMTRSEAGRKLLSKCRLRVFGPDHYPAFWRQHFARELGFAFIPGADVDADAPVAEITSAVPSITSATELDTWMRQQGLNNRDLAAKLGVSSALVSYQRSGSRPWSQGFELKLAAVANKPKKTVTKVAHI